MRNDLRAWMKEHGLSVVEFAKMAGVHYNTIYDYLKGSSVTESTLKKIAQAMGKELDVNFKDAA